MLTVAHGWCLYVFKASCSYWVGHFERLSQLTIQLRCSCILIYRQLADAVYLHSTPGQQLLSDYVKPSVPETSAL